MNNKGQVLVLFILILPVILLGVVIGIEFFNISSLRSTTQNKIKEIISYGLNNDTTEETLNTLIDKNIEYDTKSLFKTNEEIKIKITQNKKLFGKNILLDYNYKGIKEFDRIVISEG